MNPLLVAGHDRGSLAASTHKALAAASEIGSGVSVLVMGAGGAKAAEAASKLPQVSEVLVSDHPSLANGDAEPCASLIARLAKGHSHVLMASGAAARNCLPRAAAMCGCPMVTDVVAIRDPETFVHPTYAGKALETVRNSAPHKFLSVRATAFAAEEGVRDGDAAPIKVLGDIDEVPAKGRFLELRKSGADRPELSTAQVVVSAGRGVGGAEGFGFVAKFADSIGAALGASRAAVDAGYAPNDLQIGQTGKVVAPELYIAVGISGAIQHVAGILDSRTIVAINKDEHAPIFEIADYGLVGDFRSILPELQAALKG